MKLMAHTDFVFRNAFAYVHMRINPHTSASSASAWPSLVGKACQQQGLAFVPLTAEVLGRWHEVAVSNVPKLGNALSLHTGQHDGEATSQM